MERALTKSFMVDAANAVEMKASGLNGDLHGSPAHRASRRLSRGR